ncbi:MAG: HAMP domain-containing histidine kinase, partial [Clostridia bacterium]|nr:HAMP domain-containing histidine kinase [Clostridia bacterium]
MKKIRVGLGPKLPAFALCLVFSCVSFWTGLLTLTNWDDLWSGGNYVDSYSINEPLSDYYYRLREAMQLQYEKGWAGPLSYTQQERYEKLMSGIAASATNFRYQVHEQGGTLISDNLGGQNINSVSRVQMREYTYSQGSEYASNDYFYSGSDVEYEALILSTPDGPKTLDPRDFSAGQRTPYGYLSDGENFYNYDSQYDSRIRSVTLVIEFGVQDPITVQDEFMEDLANYRDIQEWLPLAAAAAGVTALATLALLIFLCRAAGRSREWEGVHLTWHDRIPLDLYGFVDFWLIVFLISSGSSAAYHFSQQANIASFVGVSLFSALVAAVALAGILTAAVRVKTHTFWRNILVVRICLWFWRRLREGFSQWPLISRAVVLFLLYLAGTILTGATLILIPFYQGFVLWGICRWTRQWHSIRVGTERIVGGETDYQIDTRHMFPDLREHAEQLNDLGAGMNKAVQEQIKGERFKAELITNVSHDLKTPLTSIINYVDLLRKTDIQDSAAREYIDVLDRKSQRLKKLTEDLVEASKASTGNLTVNREKLGFTQLLRQALGEYEEKLTQSGLSVVATMPDHELYVEADGRHLWR